MINPKKLDKVMLDLGHPERCSGTGLLRQAVAMYDPRASLVKDLYPALAAAAGSTPARVERAMRHSIEVAWKRGDYGAQVEYFGCTVDPEKGRPTVGEYVARVARICHDD